MTRRALRLALLSIAVVALTWPPVQAAHTLGNHQRPPMEGVGDCLQWDISGEWRYRTSHGGYGRDIFHQDAAGNISGTWYNEAEGGGGTWAEGRVVGASVYLKTDGAGELYWGTISKDGITISGTFESGALNGTWQDIGQATCLQREAPRPTGSLDIAAQWGSYTVRASYEAPASGIAELAAPEQETTTNVLNQFTVLGDTTVMTIEATTWNHPGISWEIVKVWDFMTRTEDDGRIIEKKISLGLLPHTAFTAADGQVFSGEVYIKPYIRTGKATEVHRIYVEDPWGVLRLVTVMNMVLIDPSGYIYDASNGQRLAGATVSLYEKQGGFWVIWNAAQYDQTNPQVTGAEGKYGWDVPPGDYLVRAIKRCFTDAQSAAVRVPPPRTDVNLGLTPTRCSPVEVGDIWAASSSGVQSQVFRPGDDFQQHVVIDYHTGGQGDLAASGPEASDVEVEVTWVVVDPKGRQVDSLSGSGTYVVPPFGTHLPITGTIPGDALGGAYTMVSSLTHEGQTSQRATRFYVPQPSTAYLPLVLNKAGAGTPGGWITLLAEDFEGAFPGQWRAFDQNAASGEYYWAKRTCRPSTGSHSGWAVGGASYGTALDCNSHYADNTDAWLIYGPLDLTGATAAEVGFHRWNQTQKDHDFLKWMASVDGKKYHGHMVSGNSGGWKSRVFDLSSVPTLGDLRGRDRVWIGFNFQTDGQGNDAEGAYVDEIVVRICTSPSCPGMAQSAGNGGPAPPPDEAPVQVTEGMLPDR